MKCLSLTQPWASLVVCGLKKIETRSWGTKHRGPLLIHAAKSLPKAIAVETRGRVWRDAFERMEVRSVHGLPRGCIVGIVTLADVVTTESVRDSVHGWEYEFGNYDDGRRAWLLSGAREFADTIVFKGALGLFDVPDELVRKELARR